MRIRKFAAAAALGLSALALSACATGLRTQVSRYQQMPAPAGQTFYVIAADGASTGLEFNRYAAQIAQQLQAQGYTPAGAPQVADMLVKVDYGVDEGRREYTEDPMAYSRYGYGYGGFYDPFYRGYVGRPYWSRYGYYGARSPFYYGWDDPFWYASPYGGYTGLMHSPIRSYTVYKSFLDVDIVRKADNYQLFQGHAKARSQTDELGVLVPNLVEAMFTGFPGRSGETVKITVPGRKGS